MKQFFLAEILAQFSGSGQPWKTHMEIEQTRKLFQSYAFPHIHNAACMTELSPSMKYCNLLGFLRPFWNRVHNLQASVEAERQKRMEFFEHW